MALVVLVVEDSPAMRQLIGFALSRMGGVSVVEADDGLDAMKRLAEARFDLVITDINMPVMDGLKLVRRIRADALHREVPIIVITTDGASEDRDRALALGANAYITKPIQAAQIIDSARALLRRP